MNSSSSAPTGASGSRGRATLILAVVLAFAAGVLTGWLIGSGSSSGAQIPQAVYGVELGDAPQIGPRSAAVTMVIFTDFRCPFCRRAANMMKDLQARFGDDIRFVFKHHPMTALHPDAPLAHEAAAAAGDQGRFWQFHDKLFAHRGPIEREDLDAIAADIGLDVARFRADLEQGKMRQIVLDDTAQGDSIGVQGTPTLFVNGRKIEGADEELIMRVVRFELAHAKELAASGVPADRIYETIMKQAMKPAQGEKAPAGSGIGSAPSPAVPVQASPDDPDAVFKLELGNSTVLGNFDAPVTIVLFLDYECAFSSAANEIARKLLKDYPEKLRLVVKNNPQPRHGGATVAAEAALAAGAQGKFLEMHALLYADRKAHSRSDLDGYAKKLGLDMALFSKAMDEHMFLPIIQQEQEVARSIAATSTPTWFINGRKLEGNQPVENIEQSIAKASTEAQALLASGVQPSLLYKTIISKGIANVPQPPAELANPGVPF